MRTERYLFFVKYLNTRENIGESISTTINQGWLSAVLVREHTKCFGSFLSKVIGEDRRIKQPTKKLTLYCMRQQIQRANVQNSSTNGSLKERDARIIMRFRRLNRFDLFTRISVDGDEYFRD